MPSAIPAPGAAGKEITITLPLLASRVLKTVFSLTVREKDEKSRRDKGMSEKTRKDDVIKAIQCGANDYVVKPFTKSVLVEKAIRYAGVVEA